MRARAPTTDRCPGRAGLSLVELLVVLGILAVLISLLLPALAAGRGSVQRAACASNLQQISRAFEAHLMVHESFPPGAVDLGGGCHGWVVRLLPSLDQADVFTLIDPGLPILDPANATALATPIGVLRCPASPAPQNPVGSGYAACHNDVEAPIDSNNRGVFYLNSRVRPEDIPDGLSQTIFVGEKANLAGSSWGPGTRATLRNTGHPINAPETASLDAAAEGTAVGGFSSGHGGGANFAFGDGSVRWVRQGIDPRLYRLLGDRADGEPVDPGGY